MDPLLLLLLHRYHFRYCLWIARYFFLMLLVVIFIMIIFTLANTLHIMTPPHTGSVAIPHHLHLYLDPNDRTPYLQHIRTATDQTSYCLIVTTSLPSQRSGSSSTRRRPMLRTIAHVPDLVTTLTFPADSPQHQQSILTLATYLILTIPTITHNNPGT